MTETTRMSCVEKLLLLVLLLLLAGCVAGAPDRSGSGTDQPPEPATRTVTRFDDGRRGFVLHERSLPDAGARALFDEGVARFQMLDYEAALEQFDKLIEMTPDNAALQVDTAMAYRRIERPEMAEAHLLVALELVPGHPVASQEYGLLLNAAGRFTEARDIYQRSLDVFPEYLPLRRNLGILCDLYLNDPGCALEQYQVYGEFMPEEHPVQVWIAEHKLRTGQ